MALGAISLAKRSKYYMDYIFKVNIYNNTPVHTSWAAEYLIVMYSLISLYECFQTRETLPNTVWKKIEKLIFYNLQKTK